MDIWMLGVILAIVLCPLIFAGIANTYYGLRYRLPFAASGKRAINTMMELGEVKSGVTVLDMGSGAGDLLLAAAKRGARAQGIEINPFLVWLTRFRARSSNLSHLITVMRADMFTAPLPLADVVVLYLPSRKTAELQKKFILEFPSHTIIVSHGFSFPAWTPHASKNEVHAYRLSDVAPNH